MNWGLPTLQADVLTIRYYGGVAELTVTDAAFCERLEWIDDPSF